MENEYDAVILVNGLVVKVETENYTITNHWFSHIGHLVRFDLIKSDGSRDRYDLYEADDNDEDNESLFYNFDQYLDYISNPTGNPYEKISLLFFDDFKPAKIGDKVFTWELIVDEPNVRYYHKKIIFHHLEELNFQYGISIPTELNLLPDTDENRKYPSIPSEVNFFANNFEICPDKKLLAHISVLIGNIDKDIYTAFSQTNGTPNEEFNTLVEYQRNRIASQYQYQLQLVRDGVMHPSTVPTLEELFDDLTTPPNFDFQTAFENYFTELSGFYNETIIKLRFLENSSEVNKIAEILASIHPGAISELPIPRRKELIKTVLAIPVTEQALDFGILRYLRAGTIFSPGTRMLTTKYYKAIINLCTSFIEEYEPNVNDRNDFLSFLLDESYTKSIEGVKFRVSIFQNIYETLVDNVAIDKTVGAITGDETLLAQYKKQFIMVIYSIWLRSSRYNPYFISSTTSFPNDDFTEHTDYVYGEDAPQFLNYISYNILGFFIDNYNFEFSHKESKILAWYNNSSNSAVPVPYTINQSAPIVNHILELDMRLTGTYDFYQPVHLMQQNYEGDVKVSLPKVTKLSPFDEQEDENPSNYIVPVFYLKYVDDAGDVDDLIQAAELTFDLASTFYGVGAVKNLKYLRYLSPFRKLYATTITEAQFIMASATIVSLKIVQGALGLVQITAGTTRLAIKYLYDGCQVFFDDVDNGSEGPVEPQPQDYPDNDAYQNALEAYRAYRICKTLDGFLLAAELVSLGGQIVSVLKLQRASQKFIQAYEEMTTAQKQAFDDYQIEYINPDGSTAIIRGQDFVDEVRIIALLENQVDDFLQYLQSANLNNLRGKIQLMSPEQASVFTTSFYTPNHNVDDMVNMLKEMENNLDYVDNWVSLFNKDLPEATFFSLLRETDVVNRYGYLFNRVDIKNKALTLSPAERVTFVKRSMSLSPSQIDFINTTAPEYVRLYAVVRATSLEKSFLTKEGVDNMLNAELGNIHVGYHVTRNAVRLGNDWHDIIADYPFDIPNTPLSVAQLTARVNQHPELLQYKMNGLWVNTKSYDNTGALIDEVDEMFVSGGQDKMQLAYGNTLPAYITQPSNYAKYKQFRQAAYDHKGTSRLNDTEIKYIFNFLETHFNNGATKYVIEMESLLHTCTSCQIWLKSFKIYGNQFNIEIIPVFKSNKKAKDFDRLTDLINNN